MAARLGLGLLLKIFVLASLGLINVTTRVGHVIKILGRVRLRVGRVIKVLGLGECGLGRVITFLGRARSY